MAPTAASESGELFDLEEHGDERELAPVAVTRRPVQMSRKSREARSGREVDRQPTEARPGSAPRVRPPPSWRPTVATASGAALMPGVEHRQFARGRDILSTKEVAGAQVPDRQEFLEDHRGTSSESSRRNSKRLAIERFHDVIWHHSHVVIDPDGVVHTFCVYSAPTESRIREHAAAFGGHQHRLASP